MRRAMIAGLALLLLSASGTFATVQGNSSANPAASKSAAATASAGDIAAAKASHKVWVNLDSGIYHKGGRWYGKTKNGQFMTMDDAKKAGYKPAKRD